MKRNIVRITISLATLVLSLATAARAQDNGFCSNASGAGQWGYILTGTLVLPTGAVPTAIVGRLTIDAAGNFSGTQTNSNGGHATVKGTFILNFDCTFKQMVNVYDESGNLGNTAVLAGVLVDNGTEARGVFTSFVLPNGTGLTATITLNAKRLFPGRANVQ